MLSFYKFRNKRKVLLLALLTLPLFMHGQSLCKHCKPIPEELRGKLRQDFARKIYEGDLFVESLNYNYEGAKNTCWRVYSDRADNPVYSSVTSNTPIGTLDFMDELVVTNFNGTRVYVKKEVSEGGRNTCQDWGWVEIATLVLNPYAVLNEEGTTKKALTLINLGSRAKLEQLTKDIEANKSLSEYTYYDSPKLTYEIATDVELKIRYVLKEIGNVKLLSVNDKIDGLSNAERAYNVTGWINETYITNWNTRICMEPSHGEIYADEYPFAIPIFLDRNHLKDFQESISKKVDTTKAIQLYPISKNRMIPYAMRLPVLDYLDNDDIALVAPGEIEGVSINQNAIDSAKLIINELEQKRENINILFVLDATSSMEDYYAAVNQGVSEIITMNRNKYKKNLRFGAAIYRDYEDKERAFDISPLSGNTQDVKDFLASVRCNSVAPASSKHENQYQGIVKSIDKAGFNKEHSNVIILIGDAGNEQPDSKGLTTEKVGKKLVEKNINLISFQVISGRHQAYADFNRDARAYLNYLAYRSHNFQSITPSIDKLSQPKNTYELQYIDNKSNQKMVFTEAAFSRFIYAEYDEPMPLQTLKINMTEAMDKYIGKVEEEIRVQKGLIGSGKGLDVKENSSLAGVNVEALRRNLKNKGMSEAKIDAALQKLKAFSVKGYTATRFFNADLPSFRQVVFMSSSEVDEIINKLDKFSSDATIAEAKKQLYDVLLEQTKVMLSEQSDDRVLNMTLDEIWQVLLDTPFDVNGKYGPLGDTRLTDLTNLPPSKEPYLNAFISEFSQSKSNFTTRNLKQHEFRLYDDVFYWVPIKQIPGNG